LKRRLQASFFNREAAQNHAIKYTRKVAIRL
jgi:hypothetical protein